MLDAHWWLVAVLRRTVRTSAKPTASYALVERIDLIRPGPFMSLAANTDGKWFDIESIYGQRGALATLDAMLGLSVRERCPL